MAEATSPSPGRCVRWLLLAVPAALFACAAPSAPAPAVPALPAPTHTPASFAPADPAPVPSAQQQAPQPDAAATLVPSMLAGADRLRALPPLELAQEIARLTTAAPTPAGQMQLALALMQTRIPGDSQRAVQVLQRLLSQDGAEARALHPLARLLTNQMAEQRRLEDTAERQAHLLRESQRRIELLNDRLEALRAIERARPSRPPH